MSDNKVIKAGLGYTIGNYLLKGLSFLTVPIFARLLSTEDFGIYSTFVAYETILFIVLGVAIHSSYKNAKYQYDVNRTPDMDGSYSYEGYVSSTMLLLVISTVVFLIIGNLFSGFFSRVLKLNRVAINLLILYSFATAVITCYNTDASLRYSYRSYLKVSAINAILNTAISVALILTFFKNQRYMGRIIGTVFPIFLLAVIICIYFVRRAKPNHAKRYLRWGVGYSLPIVFHGLSQVVLAQFDRIMIRDMNGDAAAGIYSFGYTIFSIINVTFNSTDSVWSTWFYEKLNNKEEVIIKQYSSYYIWLILAISSALMIVSPEVVDILGSSKYYEARYCTIPIIASGFFVFLYNLPAGVEYYYAKTKNIAISTILAAIVNIILNWFFIQRYGYVAAAYTTLFTYILYFIFHYFQARSIHGHSLFSVRTISACSVILFSLMALTFLFIDYPLIRWGFVILLVSSGLLYGEKKAGMISKILKRIRGKQND